MPREDRYSGGYDIRHQAGDCAGDDRPDGGCGGACAWVLADAVYGSDSDLRFMLEDREQAYVLAVRSNHHLRLIGSAGSVETNSKAVADGLDDDAWSAHAAGAGSRGLRRYDGDRFALPGTARQAGSAGR